MRIGKKDNAIYTKELDEMEKYFLNMFKRFIENNDGFLDKSVESVITEAVRRAKKEIVFQTSAGVLSVNNMSGVVKLTLGELGGEPKIEVKYSGFNRPFGAKENTVCEGDDPRLSDKRVPRAHHHEEYIKTSDLESYLDNYLSSKGLIK